MPNIVFDHTIDGYGIFDGAIKIGVLSTKQHQGLQRNGSMVYEPVPREEWSIHWTRPTLSLALMQAVLDSIPKEP